jgi:hypothetical protein
MVNLRRKGEPRIESTHTRVRAETLKKLRLVSKRWHASQVDILDWLVDLAYEGEVYPLESRDGSHSPLMDH